MQLDSVTIRNYRSIEEQTLLIQALKDGSYTYGLTGVNEAGKSSILKALSLKDGLKNSQGESLPLIKDFKETSQPIILTYSYRLDLDDTTELVKYLISVVPDAAITLDSHINAAISFTYKAETLPNPEITSNLDNINLSQEILDIVQPHITEWLRVNCHKSLFWTADDRFLMSQAIDLRQFANSPSAVSIPLRNCFALIGISESDISSKVALALADSTEEAQLRDDLGEKVTEHIKAAWPNHRITVSFHISGGILNLHVRDLEAKTKPKTPDQRSEGFKQFISFLLTVSAQSKNNELSNTMLLLDEPETHLHPRAQEDLLKELVLITNNGRGNICFFATHSNHMIDKSNLARTWKVVKQINRSARKEYTKVEPFQESTSTYASVTYQVFGIPSSDYHNELYGLLHERFKDADPADSERNKQLNFDENFLSKEKGLPLKYPHKGKSNSVTFPTFVRNCIHHPEDMPQLKDEDLTTSIECLLRFL